MRPNRRRLSVASSSLSYAPTENSDSPRPTIADVTLNPRRRLRDGSRGRGRQPNSRSSSRSSRSRIALSSVSSTRPRSPSASPPPLPNFQARHDQGTRIRLQRVSSPNPGPSSSSDSGSDLTDLSNRQEPAERGTMGGNDDLSDSDVAPVYGPDFPPRYTYHGPRFGRVSPITIADSDSDTGPDPTIEDSQPIAGSSTASTSSEGVNPDGSKPRRFTAQEKGKGKALETIEIDDDGIEKGREEEEGEESFVVTDVKKKRKRSADEVQVEVPIVTKESAKTVHMNGKELVDEDERLTAYTCPVCFCAPDQPVMTLCGHVLCEKCLFESLIAAVKRKPNPMPTYRPPNRGRGRGRGRGAHSHIQNYHPTRQISHPEARQIGGPPAWTQETLKTAWFHQLERDYHRQLAKNGMTEENWEVAKACDPRAPVEENIEVKEILSGIWSINGEYNVVEGECPVCRNAIPGGYGPPGIGGIIPLKPHFAEV